MNQTKKRLSIINLAISMTDIETMQLQILKLGMLKTDDKIQEIINTLYDENYAQAQALINTYIDTPNKEILQRTFQREREKLQHRSLGIHKPSEPFFDVMQAETQNEKQEERYKAPVEDTTEPLRSNQEIMDDFNFFDEEPKSTEGSTMISLEDMIEMGQSEDSKTEKSSSNTDFDSLLNLKSDDVMPDNIDIDLNNAPQAQEQGEEKKVDKDFWEDSNTEDLKSDPTENDDFFDVSQNETSPENDPDETEDVISDSTDYNEEDVTLFSEEEVEEEPQVVSPEQTEETVGDETLEDETVENEIIVDEKETEANISISTEKAKDESKIKEIKVKAKENLFYPAMSYIDQKLKNMQVQYPSIESAEGTYPDVEAWLQKIATQGCSEKEIVTTIVKADEIKAEHPAEAAQLLLICAATQSKYAHFRLARALYTGEILRKDSPEAFTIINRLALNEDYPEAICDLAQFYEHGIGIAQDKRKAERLYREAMEAGIKRAESHVTRLEQGNKKLFSFFRK